MIKEDQQRKKDSLKQPLSIIKIQSALNPSSQNLKQLHRIHNQIQRISPDFYLSGCLSPSFNKNRKQKSNNKFQKFFKKEIKTHQSNIKKNPRINLIENTQRLISNKHIKLDKYVLHSTKKLQILSENYQEQKRQSKNQKNNSYFVSLTSEQDSENLSLKFNEEKRKKSHEGKRIWKGTTTRKRQNSKTGRMSAELSRYNNQSDYQNEQEISQPNKLSLYQSLINTRKLKAKNIEIPFLQLSSGDYAKIDRSRFGIDIHAKRGKSRQQYYSERQRQYNQFPKKRIDANSPQVLTIHLKRPNHKFRGNMTNQFDKSQYYQPRSIQLSHIFKRPNTTLIGRDRKDSEIQPW